MRDTIVPRILAQRSRQQGRPRRTAIARSRNSSVPVTAGSSGRIAPTAGYGRRSPDFAKAGVFRYRSSVQGVWLHRVAKTRPISRSRQFGCPCTLPRCRPSCIRTRPRGRYRWICRCAGSSCTAQAISCILELPSCTGLPWSGWDSNPLATGQRLMGATSF
jgi:hypothetical protein